MKKKIQNQTKRMHILGIAGSALVIIAGAVISLQVLQTHPTAEVRALGAMQGSNYPVQDSNAATGSTKVSTSSKTSATASNTAPSVTGNAANTSGGAPVLTPPIPKAAPNVPVATGLYLDPTNDVVVQARAYMSSHGDDIGLEKMIAQPIASWFGDWNTNVQADVNNYVTAAVNANKIPVLVTYNIPGRDCGGESAGGVQNASAYATWMSSFAAGIGNRSAIVIVEPDALAASCYSDGRASMIASAVNTLVTTTAASVYLDAGNSAWVSASTMSNRLQKADISQATGFSLNVSNFQTTASSLAYGKKLSALVANKHFIVDTSRNGNGPTSDYQWCNPAGRAIGQFPTLQTGDSLVDAYLWVKGPGGSDGNCGPNEGGTTAPAAGVWWPQYALMLVRNAGL